MKKGRHDLLPPEKWDEIKRRYAAGETMTALAKEYGVSRPLVSAKVSTKVQELRSLAMQKVAIDQKVESLPISDRTTVVTFIDMIKSMGNSLATGANFGAASYARLQKMAHQKIKNLTPETATTEQLRDIAAQIEVANKAASVGQAMMAGNKGVAGRPEEPSQNIDGAMADLRRRLGMA